ncbi:unnamed protein product [Heligmosomoides polygyrus]|uniref:RNase III domain-containing protein n=1 Tax=Heligmosomoides polygyrus TaxID=6339 RepID=A0A183FWY6_HELPZ|nr:unnamed protein product [Heligmosomoides polygyrus]
MDAFVESKMPKDRRTTGVGSVESSEFFGDAVHIVVDVLLINSSIQHHHGCNPAGVTEAIICVRSGIVAHQQLL